MCFHAFKSPFRFTNVAPFSSARWHLADYVIASVTLFWWSIAKRTMLKKKLSFCQRKIDQLHRCWWRMLGKKCVGDNYAAYKIPQLASIVRAPLTLSSSGGDEFYTYRRLIHYVTNIGILSPTSKHHNVTNTSISDRPSLKAKIHATVNLGIISPSSRWGKVMISYHLVFHLFHILMSIDVQPSYIWYKNSIHLKAENK